MSGDIKLPFGLKEGRLYHITKVENGLKCNCICPNCEAKLIARNQGKKKVPHFAHYKSTQCPGSLETAIHLMAKQIIQDELLIYTPKYSKETIAYDDEGIPHYGKNTHIPPDNVEFDRVDVEVSKSGYRPDVIAFKNGKSLNIEIKVSHEVDEEKASLIKSVQEPMLEIDLSDLTEDTLLDIEQFNWEVIQNVENKEWIHNPKGEENYEKNLAQLEIKVEQINKKIRKQKEKKKDFKELKEKKRELYQEDLERLEKAKDSKEIEDRLGKLESANSNLIRKQFQHIGYEEEVGPKIFSVQTDSGWIFQVHPKVWQSAIFLKFIQDESVDTIIKANKVKNWVVNKYGILDFVETLNSIKQKHKKIGKRRGKWYGEKGAWFFSDEENWMIDSPYKPIVQYLNYLAEINILNTDDDDYNKFRIRINSWDKYLAHLRRLRAIGKRRYKIAKKRKRVQYLYSKLVNLMNRRLVMKRIQDMIASEKRVFEQNEKEGRRCKKCLLYFSKLDGDSCPFCEHDDFKEVLISESSIKNAKHRHACNTSIPQAVEAAPIIDDSILNVKGK
ncbi:competence protein CoiA family protein [Fodinibius sp. N2]|uniref:competence protein CoiA family protein n=1 Tax=Fodinibius alkaliphilus TaxID=3140241 RepID=UPI003159F038